MKSRLLTTSIAAYCLTHTATAPAQDLIQSMSSPIAGYTQFMNNYISRGLAQSVGKPSIQCELEYGAPNGFYLDLDGTSINWVDQLYPGDSVSVEIDGLLGYRHHFARNWIWKAGVVRLQFPGRYVQQTPSVKEPHTTELFGYLDWNGLSAKLNYSITDSVGTPDSRGSWYLDLSASKSIFKIWTLMAHLGRKQSVGTNSNSGQANARFSYTDCKLSLEYTFHSDLNLSLSETWTNADPTLFTLHGYNVGGHHLALTLKKAF